METFEQQIAYFFGAKEPERIKDFYLKALKELERNNALAKLHLEKAYQEISQQTFFNFNTEKAANLEFALLRAHANKESAENIEKIMIDLYEEVFQKKSIHIFKASAIRTFLYRYKKELLDKQGILTELDQNLILALAKASERELDLI
jgi:hypothetical protein